MEVQEKYMFRALQLARLGGGSVSPNPMVGAVIVHQGKIIGEGYHRHWGGAHAEVNAINSVNNQSLLADSTLYVTLEPCSHYGKTPPCSQLIVEKHIPRVVVGTLDPFEKVRGRGVKILRSNGVEVVVDILHDQCANLNKHFITAHTIGRPFVLLKWAQSSDGYIDSVRTTRGEQQILSSPITSMWTHRERARVDAIMVGSTTVIKDNPSLTVRNWIGDNPLRIVIDRNDVIPSDSKILADGVKTIIYTLAHHLQDHHNVSYVKMDSNREIISQVLDDLYRRGVASIMIEGGATILQAFIDANMWDEARIETAAFKLSEGIRAPQIKGILINVEKHGNTIIETLNRS